MSVETLDSAAPSLPAHPLIKQAAEKLAAQLGLQPDQVTLTKGEDESGWVHIAHADGKTTLNLIVNAPGSMFDETVTDTVRTKLGQWEPVKHYQWADHAKLARELKDKIKNATADVPEFNQELLKWPGFDPDIAKKPHRIKAYALEYVHFHDYGVVVHLTIPKKDNVDSLSELKKLADSINDPTRNNEIKEILTARIADKYIEAKMKKDGKIDPGAIKTARDKARQDMAQMIIHAEPNAKWNGVEVSFRSPRQVQERAKVPDDHSDSPNKTELQAENPIYLLDNEITKDNPHPPAQKALARALIFHKGKKPIPQFIEIAGSVEIERELQRAFEAIVKTHPEKAVVFKEILESPLLKDRNVHDPKQPDASPEEAGFKEMGNKTDMIRIELPIAQKDIKALLEAMVNGVAVSQAPAQMTITPPVPPMTLTTAETATPPVAAAGAVASSVAGVAPADGGTLTGATATAAAVTTTPAPEDVAVADAVVAAAGGSAVQRIAATAPQRITATVPSSSWVTGVTTQPTAPNVAGLG